MPDVTLILREAREEAEDTRSFLFEAQGLTRHQPGQHLMVRLDVPEDPRKGMRSFTLASSPTEERAMITTRIRSASPFKRKLTSLRPGDAVAAKGPFGKFVPDASGAPAVFVAGGIGVTPFRAMLRHAIDTGRRSSVVLFTSDRTPEAIPFRREMDEWARENPWLKIVRTVTRPEESKESWPGRTGRVDAAMLRDAAGDLSAVLVYVCGPPAFVEATAAVARSLGVPDERLRMERFIGY